MDKNKQVWEEFGTKDPYFAVATHDEYRSENIDDDSKIAFFESGREHLDEVWAELEGVVGSDWRPKVAVDYGCGVGRVLLPLAERSEQAVGVDVSSSMLEEARKNCERAGRSNVVFQEADEFIRSDEDVYDLVHSYIVLQHIPPVDGYGIIDKLVQRLASGGAGMVHVTYKNAASFSTKLRFRLYRDVPGVHRLSNLIKGRDFPFMPMYEYDLDRVEQILDASGCKLMSEKETDHGFLGRMLFFRKS